MSDPRPTLAAALVFLSLNGIDLDDPNKRLYRMMMGVADGRIGKAGVATEFRRLHESGRE